MTRPKFANYDSAFDKLGEALAAAKEEYSGGSVGNLADRLFDAIIALDDCFAFDEQECRFTRARPILEAWRKEGGTGI